MGRPGCACAGGGGASGCYGTAPDDAWVLPPAALGPAPLLHHHHGLPVGEEAAEEEGERRREQQAQAVQGVVARQAGAVEVEGGVQLDRDHGQQQADAVQHRLGAGLEVLEERAELVHGSRLGVGGVSGREAPAAFLDSAGDESRSQEVLLFRKPGAQGGGGDQPSALGSSSLMPCRLDCPQCHCPSLWGMSHCSVTSQPKATLGKCALPGHSIPPSPFPPLFRV